MTDLHDAAASGFDTVNGSEVTASFRRLAHNLRVERRRVVEGIVTIVVVVLIVLFVLGYFGRGRFRV